MKNTSGKQSPSISLNQSRSLPVLLEILMLLGLGGAIVLHARLRLGLGLPGHPGFIFMALGSLTTLVFRRLIKKS